MPKGKKPLIVVLCSIDTSKLDEKVKLSPVGEVKGLDGRLFNIDGTHLLDRLNANGLELPLTVDHGWSSKYGADAAAWFNGFELRDDGIYAHMEPNDLGKKLIESKKYKYLSPEYLMQQDSSVVEELIGMGLVNQPNLLNNSLNHQQKESTAMTDDEKAKQEALEAENKELKEQQAVLTEQVQKMEENQKKQKVENAIAKGELLPSKQEFALQLEANALDSYLALEAKTKVVSTNRIDPEHKGNEGEFSPDDEIFGQLGLS